MPTVTLGAGSGTAAPAGTGSAGDATTSNTFALAVVAAGTGSAYDAAPSFDVAVSAGLASGTGAANNAAPSTDPFNTAVLTDSPERWWDTRLASGGSQPDSSGNGHTGTVHGSPSASADGLTFNNASTGDNQYIHGDDTYSGTPSTFAFEIVVSADTTKQNGTFGQPACFDHTPYDGADTTGINVQVASNPQGTYWDGSAFQTTGFLVTLPDQDGLLHHLVIEYNGTHLISYFDGTQEVSSALGTGLNFTRAMTFMVADDLCACGDGFGGLVRHAIFYEHALGSSRVTAHWNAL
jgi:hypothetical protein